MSISSVSGSSSLPFSSSSIIVTPVPAATISPSSSSDNNATTVTLSPASTTSSASQDAEALEESQALQLGDNALQNSQLILQTGQASMAKDMQSFADDWQAEKQTIASLRPDLLNQKWDIVTDQGTIQVTSGTLSASEKNWLTGILNQNAKLVADTQAINTTLVSTFGGTADMAAKDPMGMTLTSLNQSSIDGTVHFLALLTQADTAAYDAGINAAKQGHNYFKIMASDGSVLNNPVVGNISSISDLGTLSAEEGTLTFHKTVQVDAEKSDQAGMYAATLNDAFKQFLQPSFGSSSAADGTDILAGMNVSANVLALLSDQVPFNGKAALWWTADVETVDTETQAQLKATASTLSTTLGADYRSYAEALPAATTENTSSAQTTTASGVGAIQSIYEEKGYSLSAVQKAISPAMQSLDSAWNTTKTIIASMRPDLLNQNWDFVTDNGTVQATSSTLTPEQQSWLTGILNQNQSLVSSTQAVNTQLVSFYKDHPLSAGTDDSQSGIDSEDDALPTLTSQNIDGLIPFLALMAGADPGTLIRQGVEKEIANLQPT